MTHADILIIGGGIAGIGAAAHLAAHASVMVVEAEDALAYHASGRSAAMFLPTYGNAAIRALNEASAAELQAADVLSARGFLLIAPAGREQALAAEAAETGLRRITPAEARDRLPILRPGYVASAATADAWDLDADLLLQTFRKRALADGARIETGARVTTIGRTGTGWRVDWASGSVSAPILINAAGAWADDIAEMAGIGRLGLVPHRRSVAQLAAPRDLATDHWPFTEEVGEAWYAKPDAGRWLVSPADADPIAPFDAWPDDLVLAEGLARYEAAVDTPVTRPLSTWAGLRTFAPDRALVIGPDPSDRGFWWCAGQGGYGLQTAPAASALLADLLCGRQSVIPAAAYAPARFAK